MITLKNNISFTCHEKIYLRAFLDAKSSRCKVIKDNTKINSVQDIPLDSAHSQAIYYINYNHHIN
jgi:hypothetical protein